MQHLKAGASSVSNPAVAPGSPLPEGLLCATHAPGTIAAPQNPASRALQAAAALTGSARPDLWAEGPHQGRSHGICPTSLTEGLGRGARSRPWELLGPQHRNMG